jgi:hypothetical protein
MSLKTNTYLSVNTISGAVKMRDECGMYWNVEDNRLIFNNLVKTLGYDIEQFLYEKPEKFSSSGKIQHITLDHNALTSSDAAALIPLYRAPMRIYGQESAFSTDSDWKDYVTTLYSTAVYGMFNFECGAPYTNAEAMNLVDHGGAGNYSTFSISPKYNYYLKNYENHNSSLVNERNIVDVNSLMLSTTFATLAEISSSSGLNPHIYNFLTRGMVASGSLLIDSFTKIPDTIMPPEYSSVPENTTTVSYSDKALHIREYLDDFVVKHAPSASIAASNNLIMNNVYFGKKAINDYILDGYGLGRSELATAFPYYNEIDIDLEPETNSVYRQIIEDNNFSEQLLHNLRTTFKDYTDPILKTQPYYVIQKQDWLTETGTVSSEERAVRVIYKSCDVLDLLKSSYNVSFDKFADPTFKSFNVFGPQRQDAAIDGIPDFLYHISEATGSMRYFRTESSLETLNEFIANIDDESKSSPFQCSETYKGNSLYALYKSAEESNYKETIAYRLSKTDKLSGMAIQDWWFYNAIDMGTSPSLLYQDSQVKYGQTYTYTLYAYKLVGGVRYRMDDMIITRRIGTTDVGSTTYNCLEFYDPNTGDYSPMLYSGSDAVEVVDLSTTSSVATPAQIYTDQSYLADLNLYYEPALDVIEVPLATKDCTILDHPANSSDTTPFQVMDDSQQIGFFIDYADFQQPVAYQNGNFPAIIDEEYVTAYKNSYDILDNNYNFETPSKPITIEVYRATEKPTSYADMSIYKTIQLTGEESASDVDLISNYIFYDKIDTNTKYYYAFSFLNEHYINGNPGLIIEAELVDDGGYKYSLFNNLFEEDLSPKPTPETTLPFKKLIQILPAISQLRLDAADLDFSLTGNENLSLLSVGSPLLEESIWEKEFKIRLTSKKTGRMIDINLTFNIEEEKY